MPAAISVLILMLSAIAAVLAGMAVFSNNRPPDPRLSQVMEEMEELSNMIQQLQKQLLQVERKLDKDAKDTRNEVKDTLDRVAERIERKITEAVS